MQTLNIGPIHLGRGEEMPATTLVLPLPMGRGRIIFGRGQSEQAGAIARSFGSVALVIYNGGAPGDGGAAGRVIDVLTSSGVMAHSLRQRGEPRIADVDAGVSFARERGCDVVVGVGGGSAIDAAKAVAGLLGNGGVALDYMEVIGKGQKIARPALPWVAIPTTAGTGAEATRNAVIGDPGHRFKASLRSEHLLPNVALVDPELGVGVPPDVTASSGMDALCQCIEAYTSTGAGLGTDDFALRGVKLAARSLRRAYANGGDRDAREGMALAALLSGIALTNAGLGAVHGFAAPLGANFPAPHGTICAALLPHVIAANVRALRGQAADHPRLSRYAAVGRAMTGDAGMSNDAAIEAAVQSTADLARELNIPPLARFGLRHDHVPEMVGLAKRASSMRYNPVVLSDDALGEALGRAIGVDVATQATHA